MAYFGKPTFWDSQEIFAYHYRRSEQFRKLHYLFTILGFKWNTDSCSSWGPPITPVYWSYSGCVYIFCFKLDSAFWTEHSKDYVYWKSSDEISKISWEEVLNSLTIEQQFLALLHMDLWAF